MILWSSFFVTLIIQQCLHGYYHYHCPFLPLKTQRCISQCSSSAWIPSQVTIAKPLIVLLQYYWSYHHLISVLAWVPLEEYSGHELGQNLGYGKGQGGLACCSPWGHKESDMTWWLNNKNGRVFQDKRSISCRFVGLLVCFLVAESCPTLLRPYGL